MALHRFHGAEFLENISPSPVPPTVFNKGWKTTRARLADPIETEVPDMDALDAEEVRSLSQAITGYCRNHGYFVEQMLFRNVAPEARIAHEQNFGPVRADSGPAEQSEVGVEEGLAGMESYMHWQRAWINH